MELPFPLTDPRPALRAMAKLRTTPQVRRLQEATEDYAEEVRPKFIREHVISAAPLAVKDSARTVPARCPHSARTVPAGKTYDFAHRENAMF